MVQKFSFGTAVQVEQQSDERPTPEPERVAQVRPAPPQQDTVTILYVLKE